MGTFSSTPSRHILVLFEGYWHPKKRTKKLFPIFSCTYFISKTYTKLFENSSVTIIFSTDRNMLSERYKIMNTFDPQSPP